MVVRGVRRGVAGRREKRAGPRLDRARPPHLNGGPQGREASHVTGGKASLKGCNHALGLCVGRRGDWQESKGQS